MRNYRVPLSWVLVIVLSIVLISIGFAGTVYIDDGVLNISTMTGAASIPPGAVMSFARTTCPTGWLDTDGSEVSRATYSDLYTSLGVIYGNTSTTTFTLPDYRGRFLRGFDDGAGVDPNAGTRTDRGDGTSGDVIGSKQADATALPSSSFTTNSAGTHRHGLYHGWNAGGIAQNVIQAFHTNSVGSPSSWEMNTAGAHSHSITGGGDSETRPVNVNVLYCIKT